MKLFRLLTIGLILSLGLVGCAANEPAVEENKVTGTINVYTRDASSGTRGAFEEFIKLEDKLTVSAIEVTGNGDMAVKVGEDLNGIGYVSLTTDFAANGITPLSYKGVEATEENVINKSYELARPFEFVTRASGDFVSEDQELVVKCYGSMYKYVPDDVTLEMITEYKIIPVNGDNEKINLFEEIFDNQQEQELEDELEFYIDLG